MIMNGSGRIPVPDDPGSSWVWNMVVAEVIGEDDDVLYGRMIFARLLDNFRNYDLSFTRAKQVVACQMYDHLVDKDLKGGDLILLEVNEKDRSYFCFHILARLRDD